MSEEETDKCWKKYRNAGKMEEEVLDKYKSEHTQEEALSWN